MAQVRTVNVNGIELRYAVFGRGSRSFVILPGLSVQNVTDAADAIEAVYSQFRDNYTVYLFDRRENLPEGQTTEQMAADTAQVMKHLGIENADVFGASQGGMLALYLALDFPELVHKLVLGSTASRIPEIFVSLERRWLDSAKKKDHRDLAESFADMLYSDATLAVRRDALLSSIPEYTDAELAHFIILVEAFDTVTAYDRLSEIKCPVLVLGSRGDKVFGAEASVEMAEKLDCELYLYGAEYGHAVYDEAADYLDRIWKFIND